MKRKYKFKKRRKIISVNYILSAIIVLIITISVAYSYFTTNLIINGTATAEIVKSGTVNANGMQITMDDTGVITLNGTVNGSNNYFVKISNGLDSQNASQLTTTIFPNWMSQDPTIIAPSGSTVNLTVQIISGTFSTSKELNVALRDLNNNPIINCKLASGTYSGTAKASSDVRIEYLFLQAGITCDNLKIKVQVTKTIPITINAELNMLEGSITYNGITCTINSSGNVVLDGTATNKMFIKLSDGLATALTTNGLSWTYDGTVIANAGDVISFGTSAITGTASGGQVNLCLRDISNSSALALKLASGETSSNITLSKNVNVIYLFIDKGSICSNYTIKPYLTKSSEITTE